MECGICLHPFDSLNHLPLVVPCGHTICKLCIDDIFRQQHPFCPFDRRELPRSPLITNFSILDLLASEANCLKCSLGHRITELVTTSAPCEYCGKRKATLWLCMQCQYGVCENCKQWFETSQEIPLAGMYCISSHALRYTQDAENMYPKRNGRYLCDGCRELAVGTSAHCRKCMVDYCTACVERIASLIQAAEGLRCKCGKQMVWRFGHVCKKCKVCANKFQKSGAFLCLSCKSTYCISCSYQRKP